MAKRTIVADLGTTKRFYKNLPNAVGRIAHQTAAGVINSEVEFVEIATQLPVAHLSPTPTTLTFALAQPVQQAPVEDEAASEWCTARIEAEDEDEDDPEFRGTFC